jgi:hypothetical protein
MSKRRNPKKEKALRNQAYARKFRKKRSGGSGFLDATTVITPRAKIQITRIATAAVTAALATAMPLPVGNTLSTRSKSVIVF